MNIGIKVGIFKRLTALLQNVKNLDNIVYFQTRQVKKKYETLAYSNTTHFIS